jgi:hypothetical protein
MLNGEANFSIFRCLAIRVPQIDVSASAFEASRMTILRFLLAQESDMIARLSPTKNENISFSE